MSEDRAVLGRDAELGRVDATLDAAREGRGSALVLRGEPGIGKTAILDAALAAAPDMLSLRAAGAELETDLAFAALHHLVAPCEPILEQLPAPHHATLRVLLGDVAGPPPDRFRAGLAVLALLAFLARDRPVACVLDDAQWLDQASRQALAFAARRVGPHRVAVLVALRASSPELSGLPELAVGPLRDADARTLMLGELHAPLDARVRERILAEARGNPLALLELPRAADPDALAGGFSIAPALRESVVQQLEESFLARLHELPLATRWLLGLAAAEPLGDPALLADAAARIGLELSDAEPAEAAGMLELAGRVRFRHPLVRSVVYRDLSPDDRRRVHRALAAATDVEHDPERRVWHLAHAARGPDEHLAAELAASAARAQARGGLAAAAAFLERAVDLTPKLDRRAARAFDAATARFLSGSPDAALRLLEVAESGPPDETRRALMQALRARLTYYSGEPTDAPGMLLAAAGSLAAVNPELARTTYLEAFATALFAGRFVGAEGLAATSRAARDALPVRSSPGPIDLLLDAATAQICSGHLAAVRRMREAVDAFAGPAADDERNMPWMWLACSVATDLWDEVAWRELAQHQLDRARRIGALVALPVALHYRSLAAIHAGDFALAQELNDEAAALDAAGGTAGLSCAELTLGAWRGDETGSAAVIRHSVDVATGRFEGRTLTAVDYAAIVLANGAGRYEEALELGMVACERDEPGFHSFIPHEVIEAAVCAERTEVARPVLERLCGRTRVAGTAWARGIELRSRALMAEGSDDADALFRAAIEALGRSDARVHLARAYLVHGEWLRRHRRRVEARNQLRRAADLLGGIGAQAFAARAVRELEAAGGRASAETPDELTPQERRVAELVARGATSKEVAAQLILSPRTIDAHLRSIFAKLGITSRRQVRARLEAEEAPPMPSRR